MSKSYIDQGFTLVELLVVIAIMGILSSMATINFMAKIKQDRVRSAADITVQFLKSANMESKKSKTNYSVLMNGDSLVLYQDTACSGTKVRSERFMQTDKVIFGNSIAVAFGSSGQTSVSSKSMGSTITGAWGAGSGNRAKCVNFLWKIGNTIEAPGWVTIVYTGSAYYSAVVKSANRDKYDIYTSTGTAWSGPF